jgi:ATP-binding cassette, subfamily B, bacterial
MSASQEAAPLRRLWRYADGYHKRIVIASMWSFLNKAVDIAPPFLIGMAIDVVVNGTDSMLGRFGIEGQKQQIVVIAILSAIIWGLESIFEYLYGVEWRNLAQSIQHGMRVETYEHIQELDVGYFEDRATGDLMAVLNDDVNQLERFLDVGANEVIQLLTTVVLIGASFFIIAPSVAWLAFLPVPIILWGSLIFQKRIEPRYAVVREEAAAINSQLSNNLGGMSTIKAFTAEDREVERITAASQKYREANAAAIKLSSAFTPLIRVAILFGFTAMLIWGGFLALEGSLNVGLYSVMVFLTQRLLWPLTRLGQTVDLYQRAMASTKRILDVLDTQPTIINGDAALTAQQASGPIAFNAVTFSYDDGFPVLSNISLEIEPAQTTAFVGSTGSGKTTIVKLLLRFYDPDSGTITVDGQDIRTLDHADLRHWIALVSQDVFLFYGTVAENIAYGVESATDEQISAAAVAAEAHDFIMELPNGYDTIIGERGQKLSGGQRQRLSIARALLTDSPILILDEATSAVDNETEAAIQRSLARVSHNRTMIVIAHRLSTIRNADQIYVIDQGSVVETGTHDELLALNGVYTALWNVQTGVVSI